MYKLIHESDSKSDCKKLIKINYDNFYIIDVYNIKN